MVSEPREKKKPNYFRFICESILGNLSVTVFHSGYLPHLLKLSDQPYCRQKTLTASDFFGDFFRRSPFPTPTIPSGAQGGDLQYYAEIQTQFNISIRVLCSDNAREYFFAPFTSFMSQYGIRSFINLVVLILLNKIG